MNSSNNGNDDEHDVSVHHGARLLIFLEQVHVGATLLSHAIPNKCPHPTSELPLPRNLLGCW